MVYITNATFSNHHSQGFGTVATNSNSGYDDALLNIFNVSFTNNTAEQVCGLLLPLLLHSAHCQSVPPFPNEIPPHLALLSGTFAVCDDYPPPPPPPVLQAHCLYDAADLLMHRTITFSFSPLFLPAGRRGACLWQHKCQCSVGSVPRMYCWTVRGSNVHITFSYECCGMLSTFP